MLYQDSLSVSGRDYLFYNLQKIKLHQSLPFSIKILLENNLHRLGDSEKQASPAQQSIIKQDIEALIQWQGYAKKNYEISYQPARVLMQDFTGVPAMVDLATMRDAVQARGGDLHKVRPLQPVELVIDHSIQVDRYLPEQGYTALAANESREYQRNQETTHTP